MLRKRKLKNNFFAQLWIFYQLPSISALHYQPVLHQPLQFFHPFPTLQLKSSLINYHPTVYPHHLYPQNPFYSRAPTYTPPPTGITAYPASTTSIENFPSLLSVHTLQQEALSHNQSLVPLHFPLIQPITNTHWNIPVSLASTTKPGLFSSSQTPSVEFQSTTTGRLSLILHELYNKFIFQQSIVRVLLEMKASISLQMR